VYAHSLFSKAEHRCTDYQIFPLCISSYSQTFMWRSDSCFRAHNVSFKGIADLSLFVWILKPFDIKNPYESNNHHLWTRMEGWKKLGDSNPLHWPFFLWSGFEKQNGEWGKKTGIRTILTFWGIKKELLSYQPFFYFEKSLIARFLPLYICFFSSNQSPFQRRQLDFWDFPPITLWTDFFLCE